MLQQSEYPLDPHYVETEDGYILTLFRLRVDYTGTKSESDNASGEIETETKKRPAVLIMHGFLASGTEWFCLPPENSLPLMLAQEGYDCWIGCHRGTLLTGPKAHAKLSPEDKKYWDFCIDDMGYYDIPAFIDYILKCIGQEKLFYVGHSLGCTQILVALSARPEYNSKINVVAALSPAINGKHCSIFIVTKILAPLFYSVGKCKFLYSRRLFPWTIEQCVSPFLPFFPKKTKTTVAGCLTKFLLGQFICQISENQQFKNKDQHEQVAQQIPGRSSIKTMCHFIQCYFSDKCQKYDYGGVENLMRYGQPHPPIYDLGNVTAPVAIFTSDHDYLIPAQDVLKYSKYLKNLIFYKNITHPKFFHADFMLGLDAHKLVYDDVIKVFSEFG